MWGSCAFLPLALSVVLLAVGCGGGDGGTAEPGRPPAGSYGAGGLTIEQARRAGGTQLVRGAVLARDGEVRLCSALLESFPPQCGEPSLLVQGLDVAALDGTASAGGVTWTDTEVTLQGTVDGEVIRISSS